MEDTFKLRGDVVIELRDSEGNVKEKQEVKNLIVTTGKNYLAGGVLGTISSPFVGIALGTGTNAAALSDTTLQTELVRTTFDSSSTVANVATIQKTFAAGSGTGAITEAGLFSNSVSGGTMLSRVVFSVINKGAGDTLGVTWTITFS